MSEYFAQSLAGTTGLVQKQISTLFGLDDRERAAIAQFMPQALKRAYTCFAATNNKYYNRDTERVAFSPFHSAQYTILLYILARVSFDALGSNELSDKIYYLNKTLNGIDLFYEVQMPDVFFVDHPVGTVIGRGTFGRHFSFGQNNTVGNNRGIYPTIGENVQMMAGAKIIGNCTVGNNVIIAADALVLDQDIPNNSVVFGKSPDLVVKNRPDAYFVNPNVKQADTS